MSKITKLSFVTLGLFVVFGVGYFWQKSQSSETLRIVGDKKILVLELKNSLFIFGDAKSDKAQVVIRSLQDFFQRKTVFEIMEQEIGQAVVGNNWRLQNFSSNLVRGVFGGNSFLFIKDFTDEELTNLKSQPVGLQTDFWVMDHSAYPNFLMPPKRAILFVGEKKYGKKLENFAKENQVPLLSVYQAKGFLLEKSESDWEVKIRH